MATQTISDEYPLLLASASPRRSDILAGLGVPLLVRPGNANEDVRPGEAVEAFLERVVRDKLRAGLSMAAGERFSLALAADTVVVVDDEVLGKPIDRRDARRLLGRISGRSHTVKTCYAVATPLGEVLCCRRVESVVVLRAASDDELERYADSGEGLDKAGAYAIQGVGAFLVREIHGSYTNVVGLPACEVVQDLLQLGALRDFPRGAQGG